MASKQYPIQSGFGAQTTAAEVMAGIGLHGKTAIVTGGYSGIGLETTRVFATAGATVVVPARSIDKARAALRDIPGVELAPLDLLDRASIDTFAHNFLDSGRALHLLINNAGIMAAPLARDVQGYESQFAANHLGHFRLTARLLPALMQANGARVVALSSRGHHWGAIDFDDPHFQRRDYDKWQAYGQSKTANILFASGLDERGLRHGIRAFSVHPGRILDTDLKRHLSMDDLRQFGLIDENGEMIRSGSKTIAQGAATTVWCAASPQLQGMGGVYCEDVEIAVPVPADDTGSSGLRPWAADPALADRLWTLSEQQAGIEFRF
jgi:NAD(P)-dependent dehydrogenase (short-subunit alcohol dehydrogenase family)